MAKQTVIRMMEGLKQLLSALEDELAGDRPPDGLEDFKSAIDDVRLRIWGMLSARTTEDYRIFATRFRARRAAEICRAVAVDLDEARDVLDEADRAALRAAGEQLVRRLTAAAPGS